MALCADQPDVIERLKSGETTALDAALAQHRERLLRVITARMTGACCAGLTLKTSCRKPWLPPSACSIGDHETSAFLWLRMLTLQTITDVHRHHLGVQGRDRDAKRLPDSVAGSRTRNHADLANHLAGSVTSPSRRFAATKPLQRRSRCPYAMPIRDTACAIKNSG